jgi:short-subunit dehydrogenase
MALQTILVTGGSDGMGRALAIQLAAKGAHVVVVARTVSKLEYTVDALKVNSGLKFSIIPLILLAAPCSEPHEAALLPHQR